MITALLFIVVTLFAAIMTAIMYCIYWFDTNTNKYLKRKMHNIESHDFLDDDDGRYIFTETNDTGTQIIAIANRLNCCNGNVYSLQLLKFEKFVLYVRIKNHDVAGEILADCVSALSDIELPDAKPKIPIWFKHSDCHPIQFEQWYARTKKLFDEPDDYQYVISSMIPAGVEQPDEIQIMKNENRRLPLSASESVMGFVEQVIRYAVDENENTDEQIKLLRNNLITIAQQYCDVNDLPSTRAGFLKHVTFVKND
jgi:hypothetical protein